MAVHSRLTVGGTETAVVDIFWLRDGLVFEHWDVVQPVSHPHGMV